MTAIGIALGTIGQVPLQFSGTAREVLTATGRIAGLAVLSAVVAGAIAVVYRWYTRDRISNPPAVLLGIATIALYLNARTALGDIMGETATLSAEVALFNVGALLVGTISATAGVAGGDRLARTVQKTSQQVAVDDSVGRLVRTVGRVVTVELPADIEDVPGYDPVDAATKLALEGKTLVFPRGLTDEELRERVARRLREDYRVGHVDIELEADGTVDYLGLGRRAAGIGPTLPPESAAMAIRADPAHAASAGDLVQVWSKNPQRRLLNAEVRGTADDVVTIAMDAADASKLDPETRYKLVTLPVEERADRELTELLRAAPETFGVVNIVDGSDLVGMPIAALDVTVVAVHGGGPNDRVETLPPGDRRLEPGESIYVVSRPDVIRQIERAANTDGASTAPASGTIANQQLEPVSANPGSEDTVDTENTASGGSSTSADRGEHANDSETIHEVEQSESRDAAEGDVADAASVASEGSDEHSSGERNESRGSDDSVDHGAETQDDDDDIEGPGESATETDAEAETSELSAGEDRVDDEVDPRNGDVDTSDALEDPDDDGEESGDSSEAPTEDQEEVGDALEATTGDDEEVGDALEETPEDQEEFGNALEEADGDGVRATEAGHVPIDDLDIESLDDVDIDDIDIHPLTESDTVEDDEEMD